MPNRSVVVDTNILISAALKENSNPARVLVHILQGDILSITCPMIVREYREVFTRPKFKRLNFPPLWFEEFLRQAIHIPIDPSLHLSSHLPDSDDAVFLALAAQQGACLITGNLRDFPRALRYQVKVLSAADYIAWLESVNIR